VLVTTPSPGPYAALAIARAADPRTVGDDLPGAIRAALDDPRPGYAAAAAEALAPLRREAIDALVRDELLPRLLGASGAAPTGAAAPGRRAGRPRTRP
jgi:hypothetical protein